MKNNPIKMRTRNPNFFSQIGNCNVVSKQPFSKVHAIPLFNETTVTCDVFLDLLLYLD